jgi:PBP1b-binding outer membrane lipoprotein LpoB
MHRRLQVMSVLAFTLLLEGCNDPVPTVPSVAPPPTTTEPSGGQGVLKKPAIPSSRPDPTTPKAL